MPQVGYAADGFFSPPYQSISFTLELRDVDADAAERFAITLSFAWDNSNYPSVTVDVVHT